MCATPNANTSLDAYVLTTNLSTFREENDPLSLSATLDELFAGYLDSDNSEYDETAKSDRFRDYLKIKELLQIIS